MANETMVANLADMVGMLRLLLARTGDSDTMPNESLRTTDETRALAVRMTATLMLSYEDLDLLRKTFSLLHTDQTSIALLQLQGILEAHCRLARERNQRGQVR